MKTGTLWRVAVATNPEAEEAVSELLQNRFSLSPSTYIDAESGLTTVSVYLRRRPADFRAGLRRDLARFPQGGLKVDPGTISLRKIHSRDWAESWKRHFPPLEIGRHLLVKPSWSRRRAQPGQAEIVLDPGLSFGTGQHPTTLFCLRQLAAHRNAGVAPSFLDLGTGSGILAIAAVKLGYRPVRGLDFDPASIRIARANARTNGVRSRANLRVADIRRLPIDSKLQYDVVCANLTADLLKSECARIAARVKPAGVLVLAGILAKELAEVARAYARAGFKMVTTRIDKEWQGAAFVRRAVVTPRRGHRVRRPDRGRRSVRDRFVGGLKFRPDSRENF